MTTPPEPPPASEPVPPFSWPTGRGVPAYGTPEPALPARPGADEVPSRPVPVPPPVPQQRGRSRAARTGAGLAAGAGGLAKVGVLAKLFGLFKLLFLAAKLKFALSMLASVVLYTIFWGWKFAVGFVLLMLVHELGHVAELRRQGIATSAVMFVPFLGAYTASREAPKTPRDGATVAFAGPLTGAVASTAVYYLGQVYGSQLLLALAYTGFFLNLLNLLPLPPLDGGRVAAAIHPGLWLAGLAVGLWYFLHRPNLVLLLVLGLGLWHVVGWWRGRGEREAYLAVPPADRAVIAGAYVALALWCVWGMHVAYVVPPR